MMDPSLQQAPVSRYASRRDIPHWHAPSRPTSVYEDSAACNTFATDTLGATGTHSFRPAWNMLALEPPLQADTAVVAQHGLRHRLRLANPVINPRQEKHELVLDVDDLAVAVVHDHGSAIFPLGHVPSALALGAGIGLASWFALGASLKEIGDAKRILRRLRHERQLIRAMHPDAHQAYPWRVKKARLTEAMLLENNIDKWEQRTRAVFSGGVVTAGAIAELYGYLASPYLFGAMSTGVAASSVLALSIAAPFVSVFAGANAIMQFRRAYRACMNKPLVAEVANHNPWPIEAFDAYAFVNGRRRQVRNHALITGAGFLGIAAGVPLTSGGAATGCLLAPGIITVAVANQYESRKIEYTDPMSLEEIQGLPLARQIGNEMGLAYQEYKVLKAIKNSKRADYLAGAHGSHLWRAVCAPTRLVQRCLGKDRHSHETAQSSFRFLVNTCNCATRTGNTPSRDTSSTTTRPMKKFMRY